MTHSHDHSNGMYPLLGTRYAVACIPRGGLAPHFSVVAVRRGTGPALQRTLSLFLSHGMGWTDGASCAEERFQAHLTIADIALLAETDALHSTLSGPATKKLMERAAKLYGDLRYERLADISVSHLYNLRAETSYQSRRQHWSKTRPTGVPIGERRAPQPNGSPGFIRIDSVHQGDQDGQKGVYHINAVDCVTQFQLVATCEKISEAYLLPVIHELLDGFPFEILGFHSDNGSEYITPSRQAVGETANRIHQKPRPKVQR